ncbi:MAG: CPBP family intramembrane glutamic endopeptidase, partial [Acidimicrobiia bacterium]
APGWGRGVVLVLVASLAAISKMAGLTVDDLGLARRTWWRGLRWGAAAAAMGAAGYLVALAIPAVRDAVTPADDSSWGDVLLQSLVVIPLGTVLGEEFAFRGVLWSLLRRARGQWFATVVSSALFALWHVLPALGGSAVNEVVTDTVGGGSGDALLVAVTVVFTGLAGVLLCELRVRSGSLLAPILLHWAVNGLGVLFVALA